RTRPRRGAAHGCAAFSAEAGCLLGKSRRLRGPGASAPGAQAGCVSLRQVSLHKQRKVARAVTARKPLILMSAEERRVKTRPTGLRGDSRRGKNRPTGLGGGCRGAGAWIQAFDVRGAARGGGAGERSPQGRRTRR